MAIVAVHCNWEGQKAGLFEMVGIVDNTCGKRDRRESACTSAQFVPAEIETGRKAHVSQRGLYLRLLLQG